MKTQYDVCVVGGGAAGMAAAIAAAEGGNTVCIIDKNKKLGKKLYATGNGRCNLANTDMKDGHYHSSSETYQKFLHTCLGEQPLHEMFAFLHSIGVYTRCIDGYYYAISMQASAVVWALLDRIKALQVTTYLSETVTDIRVKKDGYHIQCNTEIIARKVILACGGRSYPSLGGCAEGARLAEKLGVKQEPQRPALCAVMTEENTEAVKGVRVACSAWFEEGNTEWKQSGELQITEYGLSGIMIFNLSSELGRILSEKSSVKLYVDFLPEIEENAFVQGSRDVNRSLYGYLNAYLPDKLAMYILETACEQPKQALTELTEAQLHKIYHLCRRFPFHQIKIPVQKDETSALKKKIQKTLRTNHPYTYQIVRKSLDARDKGNLLHIYTVDVEFERSQDIPRNIIDNKNIMLTKDEKYTFPHRCRDDCNEKTDVSVYRPVIIGAGPAGYFAALQLACAGYRPIVYERGKCVEERTRDVEGFWQGETPICANSNVSFGEGGAGTFSDGKLNTGIKDKYGRIQAVIHDFIRF